jgi:hypothetical protein
MYTTGWKRSDSNVSLRLTRQSVVQRRALFAVVNARWTTSNQIVVTEVGQVKQTVTVLSEWVTFNGKRRFHRCNCYSSVVYWSTLRRQNCLCNVQGKRQTADLCVTAFGHRTQSEAPEYKLQHWATTDVLPSYVGSVSSPLCVCENWKGYVVKHNYVN